MLAQIHQYTGKLLFPCIHSHRSRNNPFHNCRGILTPISKCTRQNAEHRHTDLHRTGLHTVNPLRNSRIHNYIHILSPRSRCTRQNAELLHMDCFCKGLVSLKRSGSSPCRLYQKNKTAQKNQYNSKIHHQCIHPREKRIFSV